MLRYSLGGINARLLGRHFSRSASAPSESIVDTPLSEQKHFREKSILDALAREEEAIAKEKSLRELKLKTREAITALNAVPTDLIKERLLNLQSQLDQLDQSKVQTLNAEMEQFLFDNMALPESETAINPSFDSSKLTKSRDSESEGKSELQVIKTTTASAYVNKYPNLKPTPDYKPFSSQELFLRQLAHMRRSGNLGSQIKDVYIPSTDVHSPSSVEDITLPSLMAAGCHLGHSKAMWRPSTQAFISGEYEGIHLIDLNQTLSSLRRACHVVEGVAKKGGIILYVGTTRNWEQHRSLEEAAKRSKAYYVSHRWIPGTITNFTEVSKQVNGNQEVEVDFADEPTERTLDPELKLLIKPDLVVLLNPVENRNCINECIKLRIPTIALCDTNMEPSLLTYPIPCNDDSTRASSLILGVLSKAAEKGVKFRYSAFEDYKTKSKPTV